MLNARHWRRVVAPPPHREPFGPETDGRTTRLTPPKGSRRLSGGYTVRSRNARLDLGDHLNGEADFDNVGGGDPGGQFSSEEFQGGGRETGGAGRGCLVGVRMTAADYRRLADEDGICRNVGDGETERHGNAVALRADYLTDAVTVFGARHRDGDCANPFAVEIDDILAGRRWARRRRTGRRRRQRRDYHGHAAQQPSLHGGHSLPSGFPCGGLTSNSLERGNGRFAFAFAGGGRKRPLFAGFTQEICAVLLIDPCRTVPPESPPNATAFKTLGRITDPQPARLGILGRRCRTRTARRVRRPSTSRRGCPSAPGRSCRQARAPSQRRSW